MVKTVSIDVNEVPMEGQSDTENNTNENGRDHVNISYFSHSLKYLNAFKYLIVFDPIFLSSDRT